MWVSNQELEESFCGDTQLDMWYSPSPSRGQQQQAHFKGFMACIKDRQTDRQREGERGRVGQSHPVP